MHKERKLANISLESAPCPLGCPNGDSQILDGQDLLHGIPGSFWVVKCRTCGLMRTHPRPTTEGIHAYYPDDYNPFSNDPGMDVDKWGAIKTIKRFFDLREHVLPQTVPGRLLEIGCGTGGFLKRMTCSGWSVQGVEPSAYAARKATEAGVPVHIGTIDDFPWDGKPYDLCACWMVLEHLHDPVAALKKIHGMVKTDGWLVLSLPDVSSWEFKVFRKHWYALQLPTHLYHFSPLTIQRVLGEGGWSVVRLSHQRNLTNILHSTSLKLKNILGSTKPGISVKMFGLPIHKWNYIFYPAALTLAAIGQTGRMNLICRKAD